MTEIQPGKNGAPLDRERAQAYEFGLAGHLQLQQSLADAQRQIAALTLQLKEADVANEGLHSLNNLYESKINACMAERDAAVAGRLAYESLFVTFQATMRAFKVPAAPLIVGDDV